VCTNAYNNQNGPTCCLKLGQNLGQLGPAKLSILIVAICMLNTSASINQNDPT
jgi:hypothetical protein